MLSRSATRLARKAGCCRCQRGRGGEEHPRPQTEQPRQLPVRTPGGERCFSNVGRRPQTALALMKLSLRFVTRPRTAGHRCQLSRSTRAPDQRSQTLKPRRQAQRRRPTHRRRRPMHRQRGQRPPRRQELAAWSLQSPRSTQAQVLNRLGATPWFPCDLRVAAVREHSSVREGRPQLRLPRTLRSARGYAPVVWAPAMPMRQPCCCCGCCCCAAPSRGAHRRQGLAHVVACINNIGTMRGTALRAQSFRRVPPSRPRATTHRAYGRMPCVSPANELP